MELQNGSFFKDPTPNETNHSQGYTDELFPDSLNFSLPGGLYSGPQIVEPFKPFFFRRDQIYHKWILAL